MTITAIIRRIGAQRSFDVTILIDEEAEVPLNEDGSTLQHFSIKESQSEGKPIININIEKNTVFQKPVGAVILSGDEKDISKIIDIRKE